MKYKIGYIDEDPTQVNKYERLLRSDFDVKGYDISKGLLLESLIDQVYNSDIDLLMIDYLLVDKGILTYNGDEIVRAYEEVKPRFPIIIFTNEEVQAFPQVDNPNIIYDKSKANNDLPHFVQILIKNIETYKKYITKRKDTINSLLEKGAKTGLTSDEKHTLIENQLELKNLDKRLVEVPYQLLDEQKIDELTKTTKEAQAFLESLIKKNTNDTP